MAELEDLLQHCTVKLSIPSQLGWGTGFFVAPGLILTCAHVVQRSPGQVQVCWQNQTLDAVVERSIPDSYDLALLRLTPTVEGHSPCVWLDEEVRSRDPLYLFGYPDEGDRQGEPRTFNCDGTTGSAIASILFNLGQVRPGMSGSPLLNQRTGKVCGMVKFTRDRSSDLGGGAIPTRVILEQFPELRELQQGFHGGDKRWVNLTTQQPGIDFQPYLEAVTTTYKKWWQLYTLTDAAGKLRQEKDPAPMFDFGLMVQTVVKETQEREKEKIERFSVLEGIRKYADQQVLLVGRPGSGKSTALARLLLEEATTQNPEAPQTSEVLKTSEVSAHPPRIPILVELRYWQGSLSDLIHNAIARHDPTLKAIPLDRLLTSALLLFDGVNELPSEPARTELIAFRHNHPKLPMIFTTRDLSLGGDLGIERKLEMLPLTEPQMQAFIRAYIPEQAEAMLRQLKDRLREFGQTPLLLWMLCEVFKQSPIQQLPNNLGGIFQVFTRTYEDRSVRKHEVATLKGDVKPLTDRRLWKKALMAIAAIMMQGKTPVDFRVAIHRDEVERELSQVFPNEKFPVRDILDDLLKYHLLQNQTTDQIQFRHQLIQEYYAAEYLLRLLQPPDGTPGLTDNQLKQDYLNYLKWTEPIALVLALVNEEDQALRVVKLAMDDVDLMLGARLAGEVQPAFHIKTISRINGLEIPLLLKLECWEASRSETMIPELLKFLEAPNSSLRIHAAIILGQYKCESAISGLLKALKHPSSDVRSSAARVLGIIDNKKSISGLLNIIKDPDPDVRTFVIRSLGEIGSSTITSYLIDALEDVNDGVRDAAAEALGKIGGETVISRLMSTLQNPNTDIRSSAIDALGKIGGDTAIYALANTALKESNYHIQWKIAIELGRLGVEAIAPFLVEFLNNQNTYILETTVQVLGEIGNETVTKELLKALENKEYSVRRVTAQALSKISGDTVITGLLLAFEHPIVHVRSTAIDSLGEIGNEAAVLGLLKALEDEELSIRWQAIDKLEEIVSKEICYRLLGDFNHQDFYVNWKVSNILGQEIDESIMLESVIPGLLDAIERYDYDVETRRRATQALGWIGGEAVISGLVKSLEHQDDYTRKRACEALGKIGNEAAIYGLLRLLNDENYFVQLKAISALGEIGCGCEEVTSKLLCIVEAERANSLLYARAADVLGQVGSPSLLPDLHRILHNQPLGSYPPCTSTISAIQNRCQFYNYEIFQAHLAAQTADRLTNLTNLTSDRPITYEVNAEVVQIVENNYGTIHGKQTP